jgi:hypothetical protein
MCLAFTDKGYTTRVIFTRLKIKPFGVIIRVKGSETADFDAESDRKNLLLF